LQENEIGRERNIIRAGQAVLVDGAVINMARIEGKIAARVDLHGNFASDGANFTAAIIKWPALPAPIQIIEEKIEERSQK
jgi:preprotein translocase subunit SecD